MKEANTKTYQDIDTKRTDEIIYFHGGKNLPYADRDCAMTISLWMSVTPDEDLDEQYRRALMTPAEAAADRDHSNREDGEQDQAE